MEVTVEQFKNALAMFKADVIKAMESDAQRFAMGVLFSRNPGMFDDYIAQYAKDGIVDVDAMRKDAEAGMKATKGNAFPLDIDFGVLRYVGVKPVTVLVHKADLDKFFNETLAMVAK